MYRLEILDGHLTAQDKRTLGYIEIGPIFSVVQFTLFKTGVIGCTRQIKYTDLSFRTGNKRVAHAWRMSHSWHLKIQLAAVLNGLPFIGVVVGKRPCGVTFQNGVMAAVLIQDGCHYKIKNRHKFIEPIFHTGKILKHCFKSCCRMSRKATWRRVERHLR